jgi:hypothetical protein
LSEKPADARISAVQKPTVPDTIQSPAGEELIEELVFMAHAEIYPAVNSGSV